MSGVAPGLSGTEFGGDFVIERPLSQGGMGAVYVAVQRSTGRKRALKLMHAALASDQKSRERFVREARVGAAIESDHIVEVIGAGVDVLTGTPWLAMELLEGEDLASRQRTGALDKAELSTVLQQVCHALGAAHAAGIVHRDIKPENIFLCRPRSVSGELFVKVLDFGIAALAAESAAASTGFVGTPAYMAPEQTRGGKLTPAADVWALGLLTFQLLTGKSYWCSANASAPTPMQILTEVATDQLEAASARAAKYGVAGRIPAGFDAWFARAVNRDPAGRFPTAWAAWAALAPLLGETGALDLGFADTLQSAARVASPRRRPVMIAGAAAGALVALGVTIGAIALRARGSNTSVVTAGTAERFRVPVGDSPARGANEPLVTIVVFGDFQCPFTRVADERARTLLSEHPRDIRVVFKHYPLGIHPGALPASRLAAEARAAQGDDGFWKAYDALLAAQEHLDEKTLTGIASAVGMDAARAEAALAGDGVPEAVMSDIRLADDLGVFKTPTVFVNGKRHEGSEFLEVVKGELEAARARVGKASRVGAYDRLTAGGATSAPRVTFKLPPPPPEALVLGRRDDLAVDVHYFATYNDLISILAEPLVARVIGRYPNQVHFVFWDIADPGDAEALEIAAAVHSSTGKFAWKMHDEIFRRQLEPTLVFKREPLTRERLRQTALELGVDAAAYDYEMRTQAPNRVRALWRAAKNAGITERALFIDGTRYTVTAPPVQLELAIERALAKRSRP